MKKGSSIIWLIFAVFITIAGYLAYQTINTYNKAVETTRVYNLTIEHTAIANGIFIRDEAVIPAQEGLFFPLAEEGARVAKGERVALLFAQEDDYTAAAKDRRDLSEAREQLAVFSRYTTDNPNMTDINNDIYKSIISAAGGSAAGGYAGLYEARSNIESLFFLRDASRREDGVAGAVRELNARIKSLEQTAYKGGQRLNAPWAGFYSGVVDGYEKIFTPFLPESLDKDAYLEAKKAPVQDTDGTHTKIILDHIWYYIAEMDQADALELAAGKNYLLRFAGFDNDILARVVSITGIADGICAVVFKSDYNISDISGLREGKARVIIRAYTGFKVPKEAVRIVGGVEGVFCVIGQQAKYKAITRIYEKDNYYVVRSATGSASMLSLYDEVIVKGKDLYDGKVLS